MSGEDNSKVVVFSQYFAVPFSCEQRSYQILKFPNGLVGLILTDPSEDLASCCVSVSTGHHANPDHIPGLAHLCEHMISVSSKEYPKVDSFKTAVSEVGGTSNAITTNEITSFFFSIPITASSGAESSLTKILDIFTSTFDSPLFDSSCSNREIYAVDNEHTVNKSKVHRLAFQGYKLLANKQHEFSRFSTGDFESLIESSKLYDISVSLRNFFNCEYKPNKMSFVLRGPQSLKYLQKLAISKFGRIGYQGKNIPNFTVSPNDDITQILTANASEKYWSKKYQCLPFDQLKRAVIINKDTDPVIRVSFPVSYCQLNINITKQEFHFFVNFWCDLLGSESKGTVVSALFNKDLILGLQTKSSVVTYESLILEIEVTPTAEGTQNITEIIKAIFSYLSIFNTTDKKFEKHLAKSLSQFNGIGIYNFLYAEDSSQSVWEVKQLSTSLLSNMKLYGQWFAKGAILLDASVDGFCGAYHESNDSKKWWIELSKKFIMFVNSVSTLNNNLISIVGNIENFELKWAETIPDNYNYEPDFDFDYKIVHIDSSVVEPQGQNNQMHLPPPNEFADTVINEQKSLLELVKKTVINSTSAPLGYSVKNITSTSRPKLVHRDDGCQLWLKQEVDNVFKKKSLLTIELINTKIKSSALNIAVLEMIVQIVKNRVNEYLYLALLINYCYDLYPSFKGDSGILIHVSGPAQNFIKVLQILIFELKLVVESFQASVTHSEIRKAKAMILLKYEAADHFASIETAMYGLLATVEEYTWMIDERIAKVKDLNADLISNIGKDIFKSLYMSLFLQGDVNPQFLKDEILAVVTKLAGKFEGENYNFPSSVLLSEGSNFRISTTTKDSTNCVEYYIQTCERNDLYGRTILKFVSFLMMMSLEAKIRGFYQLGYIVLVGIKTFRGVEGVHIAVVSGSYSASDLDLKLDAIIMEWYEQAIKKLKPSVFNELIEKFISYEETSNSSSGESSASIFFGALGRTGAERKIIKQHNSFWEQIDNKTYLFTNKIGSDDDIDLNCIRTLKLEVVTNYIKSKILPISTTRAKIAVLVDSVYSKEEVERKYQVIQLFMFLSSMGLPIKKEKLAEFVERSGKSQISLGKHLYKYYRENGKSLTLIASMIAKLSTFFIFSGAANPSSTTNVATPPVLIDVGNIINWQNKIGFIRDQISMKDRLQSLQ